MFPSEKNHPVALCLGGGGGHHRANAEEGAAPTWQHLHRSAQDYLFGGRFSMQRNRDELYVDPSLM